MLTYEMINAQNTHAMIRPTNTPIRWPWSRRNKKLAEQRHPDQDTRGQD